MPKANLPAADHREESFIENLFIYIDPREAARKAGYSDKYANNIKSLKLRNPKFLNRIKQYSINNDILTIPSIAKLEHTAISQALNEADQDPTTAIGNLNKLKHVTKQKKQIAGILTADAVPQSVTYNFKDIHEMMVQIQGSQVESGYGKEVDITPESISIGNDSE